MTENGQTVVRYLPLTLAVIAIAGQWAVLGERQSALADEVEKHIAAPAHAAVDTRVTVVEQAVKYMREDIKDIKTEQNAQGKEVRENGRKLDLLLNRLNHSD